MKGNSEQSREECVHSLSESVHKVQKPEGL